jgi:hypothetical protein
MERGGSTNQSGIIYQNSITALYVGRLCDAAPRLDKDRVIEVRSEAPEHVDDTIVTFADNHRTYIQAKEKLRQNTDPWMKLWQNFDAQFRKDDFQPGKDRLLLHIGVTTQTHEDLRNLCEIAGECKDYSEWWDRLTSPQKAVVEKIQPLLDPNFMSDASIFAFFRHIDVEFGSLRQIERDFVPRWMPQSNKEPTTLFYLLRDQVASKARRKGWFTSTSVREFLEENDIHLVAPLDSGRLHSLVSGCGALLRQHKHTIANTGLHLRREVVDEIVAWALEGQEENRVAILLDQAGMGKTVVVRDVLCELENAGVLVLAIKADQQLSGIRIYEDLQGNLYLPDSVERIIGRLSTLEPVIVIIDQIDALSLSLAHDQRALNVALDLVARLRLIPDVKILVSCRLFDRNNDPNLHRIETKKQFTIIPLSDQEITSVLQNINVSFSSLSPATHELLRFPLHLDLFVRAIEGRDGVQADQRDLKGISSLQELYALLWHNIILKPEPNGPSFSEREEVLRLMTEYMDQHQQTKAPNSIFTKPRSQDLTTAVNWLTSAGILIPGAADWSFIHQTFYDYSYAKQFVERGNCLSETILQSEQGLSERPKLINILFYLRGNDHRTYIGELQKLFEARNLRFHLRELLLAWFGALSRPTDEEWLVARRKLSISSTRPSLLRAMAGNPDWFVRTNGTLIQDWLLKDDQTLDTQIIPYLASMTEAAQAEVIEIVQPYLGRSEHWNNRLTWMLSSIHKWHTVEAVDLFEQMLQVVPTSVTNRYYHTASKIAMVYPKSGCRLIRLMFDQILEIYLQKREDAERESGDLSPRAFSLVSLSSELETLHNNGILDNMFEQVSQTEPKLFIEAMLPWLIRVVKLDSELPDGRPFYTPDGLSHNWYSGTFVVKHEFIEACINALSTLARIEPETFREWSADLAALPYETPQLLLANVYQRLPELYAEEACQFLLEDRRRFELGDREQYDSRQLISAIYPVLLDSQRAELEEAIIAYTPIRKHLGVEGLRWRGLESLYLLQAIPEECLTEQGIRHLRQLERKFPGKKASSPTYFGMAQIVGPPISKADAKKMSDASWLRAMRKYHGEVGHKDFGGAREQSGVLTELVKESPERFYRLLEQISDTVDEYYVRAFINGLAESDAPAEWLFNIVRRFAPQSQLDTKRTIAYALRKRINDGLHDDMLTLLESYVRSSLAKDEILWQENDRDLYNAYINTMRGSALQTIMRALDQQKSDQTKQRKWKLIEFVATDSSIVLRVGAIEELRYMLKDDRERAIVLFERLMEGHPRLLRARDVREFLYYGFYKNYLRMEPFITALMNDETEQAQQWGAELACIAFISPGALESDEARNKAKELAEKALSGPSTWRRGAARIYAYNIARESSEVCIQNLENLLDDEDKDVQNHVSGIFYGLGDEHIFALGEFIQAFAASPALYSNMHQFAKYLWEHGQLDPPWAFSVVETVLDNKFQPAERPWFVGGDGMCQAL